MAPVKPIPDGYHTIIPYLGKGAAGAIEFYETAFGATESVRLAQPDGRIGHAVAAGAKLVRRVQDQLQHRG